MIGDIGMEEWAHGETKMHGENGHAYFLGRDCWSFKEAVKPPKRTRSKLEA